MPLTSLEKFTIQLPVITVLLLHGYTVHQTMLKPFYYQLMHIMLKNTELLKHSKITLQHVSVYVETIFRELQSVLG